MIPRCDCGSQVFAVRRTLEARIEILDSGETYVKHTVRSSYKLECDGCGSAVVDPDAVATLVAILGDVGQATPLRELVGA
jgi:hypothetical protein